jgi:hypothetical protein
MAAVPPLPVAAAAAAAVVINDDCDDSDCPPCVEHKKISHGFDGEVILARDRIDAFKRAANCIEHRPAAARPKAPVVGKIFFPRAIHHYYFITLKKELEDAADVLDSIIDHARSEHELLSLEYLADQAVDGIYELREAKKARTK